MSILTSATRLTKSRILFDATLARPRERRNFGSGLLAYVPAYKPAVDAEDRQAYASGETMSAAEHDAKIEFEAEMATFMDAMERGYYFA
ncbi:hypothetical protein EP7_005633 (plasmid) [Isosphaeraceae bacterium EP7]